MKKDKKEKKTITKKMIRKKKRPDGLRMKTVLGYTFTDFMDAISTRYGSRTCYRVFRAGDENNLTYSQLVWNAKASASYLISIGIGKGDKVAIIGESCPEWMTMYLAIVSIGAIAVPVLPDFPSRDMLSILSESGAKAVCVNIKQQPKVESMSGVTFIRMDDLMHIPEIPEGHSFKDAPGYSLRNHKIDEKAIESLKPEEDDIASIIFTSGTTGASKGVVLTHKNILRCADLATDIYVHLKPGYKALSILPMSHVYEFTIGHVLTLMCGLDITFLGKPPAVSILLPALSEVRPHVMLSVPLLIEKVYKAAVAPVLNGDGKIAKMAKNRLLRPIVYRTIGARLMKTFGHRLKFFGIGGAPLDTEVEKFLYDAHFPYAIGYGLTETAPLVAACGSFRKQQKPGFIGKIVEDDDVILLDKNSEDVGEIAVKGPNVMNGYYNRPDLNDEAFTADGYFRTGDLGYIDRKNRLAIRGRVKTMILGPGGENIYPETIEGLINNQDFVEESLVVPENGGLLALIKIDVNLMADKMKISLQEAQKEAEKYVARIRKDVNSQLSSFSKISEVQLQDKPFERTPTQKIKRFLYPKKKGDKARESDTEEKKD